MGYTKSQIIVYNYTQSVMLLSVYNVYSIHKTLAHRTCTIIIIYIIYTPCRAWDFVGCTQYIPLTSDTVFCADMIHHD